MIIRTGRMTLRKLSAVDIEDLYELDRDLEVRRYIDDAGAVVDANDERLYSLQRHENDQGQATRNRTYPTCSRHSPGGASITAELLQAIGVPRLRFAKICLGRRNSRHGDCRKVFASTALVVAIALIGIRCWSQRRV